MELFRNILLIDSDTNQLAILKKKILESSKKFCVFTLSGRSQIAETLNQKNIKCVFINAALGKSDTFYILRYFSMLQKKEKSDIPIFVTSEDFNLLQEIVAEFPIIKLQILHSPLDLDDLLEKIKISGLGEKIINSTKSDLHVDLDFMNVFITTTRKIIAEMAQISDLKHSPPLLMSKLTEKLEIAISSKILISSSFFKGSYYIAFPKQTFFNFYEIVVMEKCMEINDENKDFASELANIIYGQCKKKFANEGLALEMVIPSVHLGAINYPVVILIPFESSLGKFYLGVAPGNI